MLMESDGFLVMALGRQSVQAAASATNGGEQGNRRKKGKPHFISNFGVCENHNRPGQ